MAKDEFTKTIMDKKLLIQDIASLLSVKLDITKKKADSFARAFFEVILDGLRRDKYVKIKGFGTFKVVIVEERESVNIKTGERFRIDSYSKISFTPDSGMKELVNRPFSDFKMVVLNDEATESALSAADHVAPSAESPTLEEPKSDERKDELKPQVNTVVESLPTVEEPHHSVEKVDDNTGELPPLPLTPLCAGIPTDLPEQKEEEAIVQDEVATPLPPIPTPHIQTAESEAQHTENTEQELSNSKRKKTILWVIIPLLLVISGVTFFFFAHHQTTCPSIPLTSSAVDTVSADSAKLHKPQTPQQVHAKNWTIVIAQGVPEASAADFVEAMKKEGYSDAEVAKHNGNTAIVYGHYATREEAYAKWNEMQEVSYFKTSLPDTCR